MKYGSAAEPSITFYPTENSNGVEINATVTATRVDGRFGVANKAFKFSSDGDLISANLDLTGSMSFSIWVKLEERQVNGYPHIFRFGSDSGWPSIALDINRTTGTLGAIHDVTRGRQNRVNSSPLELGSWHHTAIVVNGNKFHFYLNGGLVGSADIAAPINGSFVAGLYGGFLGDDQSSFRGILDELKVYDYAIDQLIIEDLANPDPDSGKGLRLTKENRQYGRVQQAVSITSGKLYRAIAEIEGEYTHFDFNKMPELRSTTPDYESFNVTYDGSKTTIEAVFRGDSTDTDLLSYSLWTVNEIIFRKIELIDLETGRDLIRNGNFDTGLAFWTTDGGTIDIVDLEGPITYTLREGLSTGGSVSGFGEFKSGTEVILTAIPDPGFVLDSWTGSASGIQNPLSITMNRDRTVGASFIQDTRDTDGDGLSNYLEIVVYNSKPNSNDSDGDSIADGVEIDAGLDINSPESIADAVAFLVAERDSRPTLEELTDARLGSVILAPDAETNKVTLRFCIEESNQLGEWITRDEEAEIDVPLAPGKKFFRFSVKKD